MAIDVNALIARGKSQLGVPYSWGGGGPRGRGYGFAQGSGVYGFDCSSLMQYIFAGFGVNIPRVTYDQYRVGAQVSWKNLQAGDMVFFRPGSRGPEHVGMYIGQGKFLHAPKTGDVIKISNMSDYASSFMGGRRVAEIKGGGNYDPNTSPNPGAAVEEQEPEPKTPEDMAAEFGWSYSFLNSNPELKKTFDKAVAGSWTQDRFKAEIANTNWWKKNSETQRQSQIMEKTDPATFNANVNAAMALVRDKANQMGAYITDKQLMTVAKDSLRMGLNDQQLTQTLANFIKFNDKHTLGGNAARVEEFARTTSRKNGVQLSDQTIKNYAVRIAKGMDSMENFGKYIRGLAASMFPAFKQSLDAGSDMLDLAKPYVDMMSDMLELDPGRIDIFDPTIRKALTSKDAAGNVGGLDLGSFEELLRKDPRWVRTKGAQTAMLSTGAEVLKSFGLVK